jgi:hypothetical protein
MANPAQSPFWTPEAPISRMERLAQPFEQSLRSNDPNPVQVPPLAAALVCLNHSIMFENTELFPSTLKNLEEMRRSRRWPVTDASLVQALSVCWNLW